MPASNDQPVSAHYTRPGLGEAILQALREAGRDPAHLAWDDLAPVDQFHTRGRDATLELAALAGVREDDHVLDVGGGIGGPARTLAATVGCRVTVLDVTEDYCRIGEMLTRRTGLDGLVRFRTGDALAMPFDDASFDVAWTQHSSMNVAGKARLYEEIHRVVRGGGRLAMHEIVAGPGRQPLHFPVPWAFDPSISFLLPAAELRSLVAEVGFRELEWRDVTAATGDWLRQRAAATAAAAAPPLGLHLLLGADFAASFRNLARNVEEGRVEVIEAVFERV